MIAYPSQYVDDDKVALVQGADEPSNTRFGTCRGRKLALKCSTNVGFRELDCFAVSVPCINIERALHELQQLDDLAHFDGAFRPAALNELVLWHFGMLGLTERTQGRK